MALSQEPKVGTRLSVFLSFRSGGRGGDLRERKVGAGEFGDLGLLERHQEVLCLKELGCSG